LGFEVTPKDMDVLAEFLEQLTQTLVERFEAIEQRLKRLEEQPRQSLAAKLRAKK
jgi:hypothetical protein